MHAGLHHDLLGYRMIGRSGLLAWGMSVVMIEGSKILALEAADGFATMEGERKRWVAA